MFKTPKRRTVNTASIPAPVGGLNARDSIAEMPAKDAVTLTNWFPTPTNVRVRNGYINWATGLPAWVETLALYNGPVTKKLFAVSGTAIYDVSSSGAVGAAVVTGLTNARWQTVQMGTAGGQFLIMVNGVDAMRQYDGTTWSAITGAITGVSTLNIAHINVFKNRLWMVEKNTMKVWYLPVNSITGAASSIDLGSIFKLGGYLMAMGNWTIDNYAGIDDFAVFVTSEGEVAIYKGSDPTTAAGFTLQGTFRVGRPIGRRCLTKVAADVALVSVDGLFALSKALLTDRTQLQEAITDKITNLVTQDAQSYQGNFGWQCILYPIGNKLILNVPQTENNTQYQYVMNTINKSWCKFTGWNSACWEFYNDGIYFGGNGVVCQADTTNSDNGANIYADIKPAFSYFGAKGRNKRFTMVRPIFLSDGSINAAISLNTDFNDTIPTSVPSFILAAGSVWDVAPWDTSSWASDAAVSKSWQSVTGIGFAGTLRMQIVNNGGDISLQSIDYVYENGGIL